MVADAIEAVKSNIQQDQQLLFPSICLHFFYELFVNLSWLLICPLKCLYKWSLGWISWFLLLSFINAKYLRSEKSPHVAIWPCSDPAWLFISLINPSTSEQSAGTLPQQSHQRHHTGLSEGWINRVSFGSLWQRCPRISGTRMCPSVWIPKRAEYLSERVWPFRIEQNSFPGKMRPSRLRIIPIAFFRTLLVSRHYVYFPAVRTIIMWPDGVKVPQVVLHHFSPHNLSVFTTYIPGNYL